MCTYVSVRTVVLVDYVYMLTEKSSPNANTVDFVLYIQTVDKTFSLTSDYDQSYQNEQTRQKDYKIGGL